MSFGPTKSPIVLTLPLGKICQWTMTTQAGYMQNLTIKDGRGKTVVNQSGTGTPIKFIGQGTFKADSNPYSVTITANGKPSLVLYSSTANLNGTTVAEETFIFGSEDAGDSDFNDTFVTLTAYGRV